MKHSVHQKIGRNLLKFSIIFVNFTILAMFSHCNVFSQSIPTNVLDSIKGLFPPDSMYVKNEVIIKFKKTGVSLEKLCYTYSISENITNPLEKKTEKSFTLHPTLEYILSTQRFSVDSLIPNISLRNTMKAFGGDTLRRVTFANPCVDTFSITRMGDTIPCTDYLWMVLQLNNDTSVVDACIFLTYLFQNQIEIVGPNLLFEKTSAQDEKFEKQLSLKANEMEVPLIWNKNIYGDPSTKVAVLDNGIDYYHCDLGNGEMGTGKKVIYGWWNQDNSNTTIYQDADHGTPVAGIIGAYTNRLWPCASGVSGVAGIAGGWGTFGTNDNLPPMGVSLLGYKLTSKRYSDKFELADIKQAIRHASTYNPNSEYGQQVHIINMSFTNMSPPEGDNSYEIWKAMLSVDLNYAFENDVTLVAARGNLDKPGFPPNNLQYPANFEHHKIISVGGYGFDDDNDNGIQNVNRKIRHDFSRWGNNMDLLAPNGDGTIRAGVINNIHTTAFTNNGANRTATKNWEGTSAAAPHATGLVALLHSTEDIMYDVSGVVPLPPEDYQGLLKISCEDITNSEGNQYTNYFDDHSGWGWLRASKIYQMLDAGYRLLHFSVDLDPQIYESTNWERVREVTFSNDNLAEYKIVKSLFSDYNSGITSYRSEISQTVTLPARWNNSNGDKIYVWGRSGPHNASTKTGYNITENGGINFLTGFTGIVSGYGGNNKDYNIIHDAISGDHEINVITYQYKLTGLSEDKVFDSELDLFEVILPPTEKLGFNFSVFAKETITSVEEKVFNSSLRIQQLEHSLLISNTNTNSTISKIEVFDILGNSKFVMVDTRTSTNHHVELSTFQSGMYLLRITQNNQIFTHSFAVVR
jgi:subtilisin family serine protease